MQEKEGQAGSPASNQQRQDFLWKTDEYLANYARFADTKAGFIGALAISLFGWMLSRHLLSKVLHVSPKAWSAGLWLSVLAGVLLLGCAALAIWAVYPRLRSTRTKGIVFWGNIAAFGGSAAFKSAISGMSSENLAGELAQHVYDVATFVCIPKYRYVSWSIRLFVLGVLILGVSLLIAGATR